MIPRPARSARGLAMLVALALAAPALAGPGPAAAQPHDPPLGPVRLPKEWQDRFWATPQAKAFLKLSPKELADLVPVQAGLKYCACPVCDAPERGDPLVWSIEQPKVVVCRKCKGSFPNDTIPLPSPADKKLPTEKIEVLPGRWHFYPYHPVELEKAKYPDERLYLHAKRDYEARAYLAKAALYAAVRWHDQEPAARDPKLAQAAAALILRFAQVYPAYAMHNDQPGVAKQFQPARVPPPYRHGYQTAKWECNGSLETPMNLLLAYSLLRDGADWAEAGRLLECSDPKRIIEEDLFLASAELASRQPDDYTEDSLAVYRGMLSVGKLLGSQVLVVEARSRLDEFTRRGFYYDGFWRGADVLSHRRVLGMLDGWIDGLLTKPGDVADGRAAFPMIELARTAGAAVPSRPHDPDVRRASWPIETGDEPSHRPLLLGGAGLALLSVGEPGRSLDVEIRGRDGLADRRCQRLAFRLSVGGVPLLDDLDERPPTADGFDLATASHNAVVVDGLNQRETPQAARVPTPGSDFLYFAADPDFQVVTVADRFAYPISTKRYRQTFVACRSGPRRYALSIFEVDGGLQHDQIFHAAPGRKEEWRPLIATQPTTGSLLPPSISFLPSARPQEGRWFVQSYGEFRPRLRGVAAEPCRVVLDGGREKSAAGAVLKLHLLGDMPSTLITADSADAPAGDDATSGPESTRSSLIVRRRSDAGQALNSTFVTVFEPVEPGVAPLDRVARVESIGDAVVVLIESPEGSDHLVFNRRPGTTLRVKTANGRFVSTDGLAVRVRGEDVFLAGGTYVEAAGKLVSQKSVRGTVTAAERDPNERGRGWFQTPEKLPEGLDVAGRTLFIEHGDGTVRSWTLDSIEPTADGARLRVREEPGFRIDPASGAAGYYQFPLTSSPGPHRFRLAQLSRSPSTAAKPAPKAVAAGRAGRSPAARGAALN
ncbi:hypothetical protein [Paludisphaera mucosa]|uniref:Heparinase II/III-like protein n=1 Tax=Paludisphaera mucosa TaxID=3030827 RepID=A0ABT6FG34_9BACT|nr:hypothetical protein [Paludisphaera mucosa]MDG3006532.1 hypothetical protein [Paludisphaera mucosa]